MKSLKVERDGINFVGLFELTIKGITKQVRIPFTFKQEENQAIFRGKATINRKDWTIGGNTFGMSSDVTISILINAVQN
jgi:polyisoprenoid-binding protein YceI